MDINANKSFNSSQVKSVQFGEYPVTKSVNIKQSKFTSSNYLIPASSVEFGENEKTTNEISKKHEYNPSEVDILLTTYHGDNLQDIQNSENYANEQINSTFEIPKTENYIGEENNVQYGEYPSTTTFGINNNESSFNLISNAEKSSEEYVNSNIISGNLETSNYQITDSNINIGTNFQTFETSGNSQGFENLYGESNNYPKNTYEFTGNGNNSIQNEGQTYDEYKSTTKIENFENGFEETNYTESTPMDEDYQISGQIIDQLIDTSDSIDNIQIVFGLPEIKKKTNYKYSKFAIVTPLETTETYFEDGTTDYNYQTNENESYGKTTTTYENTYKNSVPYIETGTIFDETTYQATEPYFETLTALDADYQISEPYFETSTTLNADYQIPEPNIEDSTNEVYQIPEQEISQNIDYTSLNIRTSQEFDSNTYAYPSNMPNIEEGTTFDKSIYQTTEAYTETEPKIDITFNQENKQYGGEQSTLFEINDNIEKETYIDTTPNFVETSSDVKTDYFTEGYEGFDNTSHQINEPVIETSSTIDKTSYGETVDNAFYQINEPIIETSSTIDTTTYGETIESLDSYNISDNYDKNLNEFNNLTYLETEPLSENITNYDEAAAFPISEPYFEIATTVDTTSYQESKEKTGEEFNYKNYEISEPYVETTENFDENNYISSEPYFETSNTLDTNAYQTSIETPINYQKNENNLETESINDNYQINEPFSQKSIKNDNQITDLNGEITKNYDDINLQYVEPYIETSTKLDNIEPEIFTTSTLETTAYTTEKTSDITSYESTKPSFNLQTNETKSYEDKEIYDITDNFVTPEYQTLSSPIIESIPTFSENSENKEDKTSTLKTLDNKSYETTEIYQITEPITNNYNYCEYKKSTEPIMETKSTSTYQEFKSSNETINFTTITPSFEAKEPITTITTIETNPEFEFSFYNTEKPNDVERKVNQKTNISDVKTENIIPEYSSKTYQVKKPVIKTGLDYTNLGTSSNYNKGVGYNTSKKSHQKVKSDINLPTTYTTIKTVSKPVKTSTYTTYVKPTPLFDANKIYKEYKTIHKTKTVPKKQIVTSSPNIPTNKVTKTEYISGPKISTFSKPETITYYTKPYKIEKPPTFFTLPEPIIPSLLDTGNTFGEYKISQKEKKVQYTNPKTYNKTIIKSSTPKSLVPLPQISMVPPISIVPQPIPIRKAKKKAIIVKIPKIQKVHVPKIKQVIIPRKKRIYINKKSTIYVPKPSLSIIKTTPINAPLQAVLAYPLKSYSTPKIIKYNQNVISQIPNMNVVSPIQPQVQFPNIKYCNRTYSASGYGLPNMYSGATFNSSKSRNNLNFVGNKYTSRTYQARKL